MSLHTRTHHARRLLFVNLVIQYHQAWRRITKALTGLLRTKAENAYVYATIPKHESENHGDEWPVNSHLHNR